MTYSRIDTLGNILGLKLRGGEEIIRRVRDGFPAGVCKRVIKAYEVSQDDFAHVIHVNKKTIQRQAAKGVFAVEISDRLLRLADVFARASEVFEDKNEARAWMQEESRALGGVTPWSLLDTSAGIDLVIRELGRIEHGIVS
jgi:putative toxin-antitoxin system antitoxin component (TIGR02293 family)